MAQSRFLFSPQLKIHRIYDKFNIMLQTLANIFRQIKIKIKIFVWFFSLYELFTIFISAKSIGSLVNSLFEVKIFNPFRSFTSYSSPSNGDMSVIFNEFLAKTQTQ